MSKSYQLAFTLQGHAGDVRSLNAPSPDVPLLLSGSRDGSAIVWGPGKDGMWEVKLRVEGPEKRFVSCVAMTRHGGEAYLLVGSSTGILSSFTLPSILSGTPDSNPEPKHMLVEHKQNLCCLDTSQGGLIASGSWDHSAKIWKDWKVVVEIKAHEASVWAIKFVGEDRILTAGADNKIILHSIDVASGRSTILQEYSGHTQPVRGLSLRPDGKGFWSCANDGLVNIYNFDKPAPVQSLSGHTSFVYSVSALPDGSGAITSGEDGTLRVWSESELVQTIAHPSNSLWSCATLPAANGSTYIASSSQDSSIRFFTKDDSLIAPAIERERWDKEVADRQLDKSQVGDVKHSDLPGMEALGREGKKDGQVIMIKNKGAVEAYSWQSSTSTWQQVGTVVDAIGQGRKQLYDGKEYDYVFDVDVSEGMPPLKLPYNVSENPWVAAQKFLDRHELPSTYTEQVVGFIEKNTGGATLGAGDAATFVDPYTGASRYTGASAGAGPSYGGGDPFTGGSAYSSTPAPPPKANRILPVKTYLSFKTINVDAAKKKINQLNDELKTSSPDSALSTEEEKTLFEVYAFASQPAVALPNADKKSAGEKFDPTAFTSLVSRWPEAQRFPLLDVARYLAAVSPAFGLVDPSFFLQAADWDAPWQASKPRETNTLLALRGIANQFSTLNGRVSLVKSASTLLSKLKARKWEELGPRKVPLITIALNYSALGANGQLPASEAGSLLELIHFVLENEKQDSETLYRASIALGNLLISPATSGSLQVGAVQSARALVVERAGSLDEKRLKDVASEIGGLGA